MCWGQQPWAMFRDLPPFSFSQAAANLQANTRTSAQGLYAAQQPQQPTSVCILMPREAALNIHLKGFPCVSVCVWAGVCGHGVLFIHKGCVPVPFPTLWASSFSSTTHWNNIQTHPWTRLHVCVWPSDFRFWGDTEEDRLFFFFFNHTVAQQCESFCTVQVCPPFPPSPQYPPTPQPRYQHRF